MNDEADHKAVVTLAMMMGEVKKGVDNLEAQVTNVHAELVAHKADYADGKAKAREAHAETMAVVAGKIDRVEFEQKYTVVGIAQWLWDHWSVIVGIIAVLTAFGIIKYGDRFRSIVDRPIQEQHK